MARSSASTVDVVKLPTRVRDWWPLLIVVAALVIVVAIEVSGGHVMPGKPVLEVVALVLTSLAAIVALVRVVVTRHAFRIVLFVVTLVVLAREIHWDWTTRGVFVAVGGIVVWAILWRGRIRPYTKVNPTVRVWLISTAVVYVLSQLIAKKAVHYILPAEWPFMEVLASAHCAMEEVTENVGHAMLLVTTLIGPNSRQ